MSNFNLDQAEVVELENKELSEVDGGIVPVLIFLAGAAAGYLVGEAIDAGIRVIRHEL